MLLQSLVVSLLLAQAGSAPALPDLPSVGAAAQAVQGAHEDAQRLSQEAAKLTGVQLSPLFMMGALGGYRWMRSSPEVRGHLPWHQQPWFWGGALLLAAFLWIGDKVPGARHGVKHLKLFENKVSGVIATAMLAASFAGTAAGPIGRAVAAAGDIVVPSVYASGLGGTSGPGFLSGLGYVVAGVVGVLVSAAVWLAGHSINVLALLNPFAPLDSVLRAIRLGLIAAVFGAVKINPVFGLVVAAAYAGIALLVAGWTLRLTVFGAVFSSDFLLRRDEIPQPSGAKAFAAGIPGVPNRTYGSISRQGLTFTFSYRPLLVLPERRRSVNANVIGRGLLSPVLMQDDGKRAEILVRFPPRFRSREDELARVFGGIPVVDLPLVRGLKAALAWVKGTLQTQKGASRAA